MKNNVNEKEMTPAQKKKREEIVLSMKKNKENMKKQYGADWENVMYATATKQAMKEAKKSKPDFLDLDKDGDKKETMKKAAKDKKKKVTEGVLDSTDDAGWMAKSQLYKLAKYAAELHKMIDDSDDLEPWVQAKITAASEDISAVKHYIEYLLHGGDDMVDMVDMVGDMETPSLPPQRNTGPSVMPSAPVVRTPMSMPESKEPTLDDIMRPVSRKGINEKWEDDAEVEKTGEHAGKTVTQLRKELSNLKASGPHKKGSKDYEKMNELEFAIRAKTGWGKVDEAKKKSLRNPKDNPCWDDYEPVGTKKVKGKVVPNCVPKK